MLTVRFIPNIFTLNGRTADRVPHTGDTLASYSPHEDMSHCSINGAKGVPKEEWDHIRPCDNDDLAFMSRPKDPATITAGITAIFAASNVFAPVTAKVLGYVISGGLAIGSSFAASFAASRLLQPEATDPVQESLPQRTHVFEGLRTTSANGPPVPVAYGQHPLSGNIIARTHLGNPVPNLAPATNVFSNRPEDDRLYLVVAWCEGEVVQVNNGEMKINGADAQNYFRTSPGGQSAVIKNAFGTLDDQPETGGAYVPAGGNASTTTPYDIALPPPNPSPTSFIKRTLKTQRAVDKVRLNVALRQGLIKGTITAQQVKYAYRYKKVTDTTWSSDFEVIIVATHPYAFTTTHDVTLPERAIYDLEIWRTQELAATQDIRDEIALVGVTEETDEMFAYPGTAKSYLRFEATDDFRSEPNVVTTGIWRRIQRWNTLTQQFEDDAPFYNNPAWVVYDMLTNRRYGYGRKIRAEQIDLESFSAWAEWCNELVFDGVSGSEKRATFDGVFESNESLLSALQRVLQVGRASLLFVGSKIKVRWERVRPIEDALFNDANIVQGSFRKLYLKKSRTPNRVEVSFRNAEKDYQFDTVPSDDEDAVQQGQEQITETIELFGIVRRSHALRESKYHRKLLKYVNIMVQFDVSIEALPVEPGDLVKVAHSLPQWGASGRVSQAPLGLGQNNRIALDHEVVMKTGENWEIEVRLSSQDVVDVRRVSSPAGTYPPGSVLTVDENFTAAPQPFDVFTIGRVANTSRVFEVVKVRQNPDLTRTLICVNYTDEIHNDL